MPIASIVVAEDSEDVRDFLEFYLRGLGYRVLGCDDADQAYTLVRREHPDLVLTDLMLGVTSGLELITRLRSDLIAPPPIIATSGMSELESEALARGAWAFLPKPLHVEVIREAIESALRGGAHDRADRERAVAAALSLRSAANEAAREARARHAPRWPEIIQRARWTADWLPRYLGFGAALVIAIDGEELEVLASSESTIRDGEKLAGRLPLVYDVLETGSAIVLPIANGGDSPYRFFAGFPLQVGRTAIGSLCLVDTRPHALEEEDFALLSDLSRRGSVALGGTQEAGRPLWEITGMITPEGFDMLLDSSLSRAHRLEAHLDLLLFEATGPRGPASWLGELSSRVSGERMALSRLVGDRFGFFRVRQRAADATRDLTEAVRFFRRHTSRLAGGLVSIDGAGLPALGCHEVLRLAESLLARESRRGGDRIERVVLRHEPAWLEEEALPARPEIGV